MSVRWHRVESLGDHDEGSLSVNFSVDGARWGDVVLRCLQPLLWGSERARERVRFSSPDEAREAVAGVLSSLKQAMEGLAPSQLIPQAVLSDERPTRVVVLEQEGGQGKAAEEAEGDEDSEEEEEEDQAAVRRREKEEKAAAKAGRLQAVEGLKVCGGRLTPDLKLRRNPMCVLVLQSEDEMAEEEARRVRRAGRVVCSVHYGFERDQASGQVGLGGCVAKVEVPAGLGGLMRTLEELGPEDTVTVEALRRVGVEGQQEAVDAVLGVLLFQGYLVVAAE